VLIHGIVTLTTAVYREPCALRFMGFCLSWRHSRLHRIWGRIWLHVRKGQML